MWARTHHWERALVPRGALVAYLDGIVHPVWLGCALRSRFLGAHVRTASSVLLRLMDTEPQSLRPRLPICPKPLSEPWEHSTRFQSWQMCAPSASLGTRLPWRVSVFTQVAALASAVRSYSLESQRYSQECPWDCGKGPGCRF